MRFIGWKRKVHFNVDTLKKNDISILTLDERWNKIFTIIPISSEVKKVQDSLNKLLSQEAALYQEQKNIEPEKKKHINIIMSLTQEAFEKNNENAKKSLVESKNRIEFLNKRSEEIENELLSMQDNIRGANFKLLEETVAYVYDIMAKSRARQVKIENEINKLKKKLKTLQEDRQSITTDWTEVYSFFHDLLGRDELTRLDQLFLKSEVNGYEAGHSNSNEEN